MSTVIQYALRCLVGLAVALLITAGAPIMIFKDWVLGQPTGADDVVLAIIAAAFVFTFIAVLALWEDFGRLRSND